MNRTARVDVSEAVALITAAVKPLPHTTVPLAESLGRVLAVDLRAPWELPPWTNASMDGYAVRAADIRGATASTPCTLRLVGESRPGGGAAPDPGVGEAIRIFTGALVPAGADSVIRQEDTSRDGDSVLIRNEQDAKRNVRLAGSDLCQGDLALKGGTRIGPGQLALLASLGIASPAVQVRPRIGILVSGDELVSHDDAVALQRGDRLADSNAVMLAALVQLAGGTPVALGIASDDPAEIRQRIQDAPPLDLLVTAGGVSVGDHDHLPGVMASLGAELRFRRVRLRPGGPTCFATRADAAPWLGLPGNPGAAFVTFHLLVQPAIDALLGSAPSRRPIIVELAEAIARHPVLDLYHRITLGEAGVDGVPTARLTGAQGSGLLTSLAAADALLWVPAGSAAATVGEKCRALPVAAW